MIGFTFFAPTKIVFGRDAELQVAKLLKEAGATKVLIHYGQGSVERSGLLAKVAQILKDAGIAYVLFGGVQPNPEINLVVEAIAYARKHNVDFILALGGGSVLDSAKLISVGYFYEGDPFDYNRGLVKPHKRIPVGSILTISAAGSEFSTSCVITNEATGEKRGFNSPFNRPVFAIENPALSYSVSSYQTAAGITDILMHSLERYFNPSGSYELADRFAEGIFKTVFDAGLKAIEVPNDYEARAALMLASSFSHNGVTSLGKNSSMPVHQLEHIVSGLFPNVAHGAGLAILFPAWAEYYAEIDKEKFNQFARNVYGLNSSDKQKDRQEAIHRLKDYFKKIKMPTTFQEVGISRDQLDRLVDFFSKDGERVIKHHLHDLDKEMARKIFARAFEE